jgi:hypothetical protein
MTPTSENLVDARFKQLDTQIAQLEGRLDDAEERLLELEVQQEPASGGGFSIESFEEEDDF